MVPHIFPHAATAAVLFFTCLCAGEQPKTIELQIRQPSGEPARDAQVVAFTPTDLVMIRDGQIDPMTVVKTIGGDARGKVTLSPPAPPYRIAVVHESGCVLLTHDEVPADGVVTLAAWGRIEGRLLVGEKPAPQATVAFRRHPPYLEWESQFGIDNHVETDAEGGFVIEKAFPSTGSLSHIKMEQSNSKVLHQLDLLSRPVEVRSGETTRIQLGGTGRPVLLSASVPEKARDWFIHAMIVPPVKPPEVPDPPESKDWTEQQKQDFRRQWLQSPEAALD